LVDQLAKAGVIADNQGGTMKKRCESCFDMRVTVADGPRPIWVKCSKDMKLKPAAGFCDIEDEK